MEFTWLSRWQPQLLAILRIVTGLLFLEHGLSKFFGFPVPFPVNPLPPMLMFDRITSIGEDGGEHGKGHVRAELDVRPDLWFFPCHFKGDPVMPGCLGLDAMWQIVGYWLGWSAHRERAAPSASARSSSGAKRCSAWSPRPYPRPAPPPPWPWWSTRTCRPC